MIKPKKLQPGDKVATVSLSWGGPGTFPHRYEAGKSQLQAEFGLTVVEMDHTMRDDSWLQANPQARADDLMAAFADPAISRLHELSRGIPRRITQLADLALVAAAGEQRQQVDAEVVESVFHELSVIEV